MSRTRTIKLSIQGRRIVIKDAAIMLSGKATKPECPCVEVTPGEYLVSLKKANGRVAGIQIIRAGETKVERGKALGLVSVDHGAVSICDYDVLLPLTQTYPAEYAAWTADECEKVIWEKALGLIEFKGSGIAHAQTEVGDGSFPVFALISGKDVVGLECDFAKQATSGPAPDRFTWVELKPHGIRGPWSFCDARTQGAPDLKLILEDLELELERAINPDPMAEATSMLLDQAIAKQVKRFRGLRKIEVFDETNGRRLLISDQLKGLLSKAPMSPSTTPRQLARFIHEIFKAAAVQNPV